MPPISRHKKKPRGLPELFNGNSQLFLWYFSMESFMTFHQSGIFMDFHHFERYKWMGILHDKGNPVWQKKLNLKCFRRLVDASGKSLQEWIRKIGTRNIACQQGQTVIVNQPDQGCKLFFSSEVGSLPKPCRILQLFQSKPTRTIPCTPKWN